MPSSPGYIPGPLVIPATVAVRLIWQLPNQRQATNVLHAIVPEGLTVNRGLAGLIFDGIVAAPQTDNYLTNLSSETALQLVDVRDLRLPSRAAYESDSAAAPGTGTGNALPEEVALVVSLRTDLTGRAHRGRVYLTGFDDSALDTDGHAVAGLTNNARDFLSAIGAVFVANDMDLGIAHRGHAEYVNSKGQAVAAELPGTDLVTNIVVRDNVFDSQRRRK